MGHSLSLLTATLLAGQALGQSGQNCVCPKGQTGRVEAQPIVQTQARTWSSGWRTNSSNETTYSSTPSSGGWSSNRPILSKIRGWLGATPSRR